MPTSIISDWLIDIIDNISHNSDNLLYFSKLITIRTLSTVDWTFHHHRLRLSTVELTDWPLKSVASTSEILIRYRYKVDDGRSTNVHCRYYPCADCLTACGMIGVNVNIWCTTTMVDDVYLPVSRISHLSCCVRCCVWSCCLGLLIETWQHKVYAYM